MFIKFLNILCFLCYSILLDCNTVYNYINMIIMIKLLYVVALFFN